MCLATPEDSPTGFTPPVEEMPKGKASPYTRPYNRPFQQNSSALSGDYAYGGNQPQRPNSRPLLLPGGNHYKVTIWEKPIGIAYTSGVIYEVQDGSVAKRIGIVPNSRIVAINGEAAILPIKMNAYTCPFQLELEYDPEPSRPGPAESVPSKAGYTPTGFTPTPTGSVQLSTRPRSARPESSYPPSNAMGASVAMEGRGPNALQRYQALATPLMQGLAGVPDGGTRELVPGTEVEVYSKTADKWCVGLVTRNKYLNGGLQLTVAYRTGDNTYNEKTVMSTDDTIRHAVVHRSRKETVLKDLLEQFRPADLHQTGQT